MHGGLLLLFVRSKLSGIITLISFWSIPYDFITAHSSSCHT